MGAGSCSQDEASACIVTEESPGLGFCFLYLFEEAEEALEKLEKWMCSRILFKMHQGRIVRKEQARGFPWSHANIAKAAAQLWVKVIPRPAGVYMWTHAGVDAAQQDGVVECLGNPLVGSIVTDSQL